MSTPDVPIFARAGAGDPRHAGRAIQARGALPNTTHLASSLTAPKSGKLAASAPGTLGIWVLGAGPGDYPFPSACDIDPGTELKHSSYQSLALLPPNALLCRVALRGTLHPHRKPTPYVTVQRGSQNDVHPPIRPR
ncbi:hypothetical protein BDV95DRAFT_591367 [Massariosphaeria phaeospora]|uniref:Uncharacterized protein n=1 Tax=Massariosphaeria phaeospora TaxID=100035 RepID=A0A7C8MFY5_9PLEO|nr:hypothetical protein BDV95DRAFT_591367 [Massariosphaeria phaeospora]